MVETLISDKDSNLVDICNSENIENLSPIKDKLKNQSCSLDHLEGPLNGKTEIPMDTEKDQTCPIREAAIAAIKKNEKVFESAEYVRKLPARDMIREMHSFKLSHFPAFCQWHGNIQIIKVLNRKVVQARVDKFGFTWNKGNSMDKGVKIPSDDLVGAQQLTNEDFEIHYFRPGKGKHQHKLFRVYKTKRFRADSFENAKKWVQAVQGLVKWQARVPFSANRLIKVVVNPHSGKKRAPSIWAKWKVLLDIANIKYDVEETTYGGHAKNMGKLFDPSKKYEAMVFIGGDGTVNEFLNGLLERQESEWRHIVATTPISLISAGTDNAFGIGVGTPCHEASIYCIIKRKVRPIDVVACSSGNGSAISYACCGASYGIGADIAVESEQTRWMGVYRYKWLKLKRGVLIPKKHSCKIKYALTKENVVDLKTFDELKDEGVEDQHEVEECSVYDETRASHQKTWSGEADCLHQPASDERFNGHWKQDHGEYVTVGAANLYFEAKYSHPSDGNMDLIIVRKGNIGQSVELGMKYLSGNPMNSSLMSYSKVKSLVIEQNSKDPINLDGEVLNGPGPFRMEIVPGLLRVLSEK